MRFHFLAVSAIIWILFAGTGFAQTITGTLDGDWSYNTNTPAFQLNSFRAFDIHDQAGVFWQGVAAYGKVKASKRLTVASRYEWFGDDHNAFRTGINQNLQSYTATAQFPWSDPTLWTEYRCDWSTEAIFNKTQGEDSSVLNNQNAVTFGLTYVFETAR